MYRKGRHPFLLEPNNFETLEKEFLFQSLGSEIYLVTETPVWYQPFVCVR